MSDAERGSPLEYNTSAPTATVSSLKSEDSTEQLICKTPQKKTNKIKDAKEQSVTSKSVEAGSDEPVARQRLVVFLGLAQVVLGALLVGAGAVAVVKGAALARVGAGLWAGCAAVVTGVVGVLAGINDCYGLYGVGSGPNERSVHPSLAQVDSLVDYMERHPSLAKGYLRTTSGRDSARRQWEQLSLQLNSMGGTIKTWKQWAKYWTDKKSSAKKKGMLRSVARRRTGGGNERIAELSEVDERIISLMGGVGFFEGDRHLAIQPFHILCTLSFLASGSYQKSIGKNVNTFLSQSATSRCISEVVEVLTHPSIVKKYIRFPQNANERQILKEKSPLLTAFLALSLLCLACGNSAAVLAATGLQRDSLRAQPTEHASFDDEMQAWTPVLTNIALLIIATLHCLVCVVSIYHLSKRVCPCFRKKPPFDHNQFDPTFKAGQPFVIHLDEKKDQDMERTRNHELCKDLEVKLQGETTKKKKEETGEFGSANSKEKLVTRWLGRHHSAAEAALAARATGMRVERAERAERAERSERRGVRKQRPRPAPLVLMPAHPASTLGRMPAACVMVPPRYATLPLPPPPMYYPVHDTRLRRRRSPRVHVERRRRELGRPRDSQLARSLERIHRKRRADRDHLTDDDLKRTYTGLDRAYAEQFIAVIDENRHAAEHHDSLPSTATSDSVNSTTRDL